MSGAAEKNGGFGELLGRSRKRARLTQVELAQRIYVNHTLISHWENGRRLPVPYEVVTRIAEALKLTEPERQQFFDTAGYSLSPDQMAKFLQSDTAAVSAFQEQVGRLLSLYSTTVGIRLQSQSDQQPSVRRVESRSKGAHETEIGLSLMAAEQRGLLEGLDLRPEGFADRPLEIREPVVVRILDRLRDTTHDPLVEILGIFNEGGGSVYVPLALPLRLRFIPQMEGYFENKDPRLLCMPGLDVPAEFRDSSYLQMEHWGTLKLYLAHRFIAIHRDQMMRGYVEPCASVDGMDLRRTIVVRCPSYQAFLSRHWLYYKAVESAFSHYYYEILAPLNQHNAAETVEMLKQQDPRNFMPPERINESTSMRDVFVPYARQVLGRLRNVVPSLFTKDIEVWDPDEIGVALMLRGLWINHWSGEWPK